MCLLIDIVTNPDKNYEGFYEKDHFICCVVCCFAFRVQRGEWFFTILFSRLALLSFHEGHKTSVYVSNIKEILTEPSKAPYFLNSIFDQLKTTEDYEEFYSSIDVNAKFVFTIPAYVTGMLLYYSGMLIGKTIKAEHLETSTST